MDESLTMARDTPSASRQIRNLLLTLGGGVLVAFLVVGSLLYIYSPTGAYKVKNILLAPSVLDSLSLNTSILGQGEPAGHVPPSAWTPTQRYIP